MFIVGIAGGSGSGKTTFAKKILSSLDSKDCQILHQDSYYLPEITGEDLNFDHPDAFDWELLVEDLGKLKSGESIEMPIYDYKNNCRAEERAKVRPRKVLILEGIFSLYDLRIRDLLDLKCFLQVDADIRFTRRLHRDINDRGRSLETVITQYYKTVRPMYQKYLEPQKQFADFTVGEETDMAAEIVTHFLKSKVLNAPLN